MVVIKNPTHWRPPSGEGYVIDVGNQQIVTNAGDSIVTNSGNNLVTNESYLVPKYKTLWTPSGV